MRIVSEQVRTEDPNCPRVRDDHSRPCSLVKSKLMVDIGSLNIVSIPFKGTHERMEDPDSPGVRNPHI